MASFHPNPGWEECDVHNIDSSNTVHSTNILGQHCILELYDCNEFKLNDEAFLRHTIGLAVKLSGATLLNLITHRFEPQGVTGLALLAESHISIHTWPETGYAAVDVFTCGDHTMPERACEVISRELSARHFSLKSFQRQVPGVSSNNSRRPHFIKSVSS